jgi:Subtilase family
MGGFGKGRFQRRGLAVFALGFLAAGLSGFGPAPVSLAASTGVPSTGAPAKPGPLSPLLQSLASAGATDALVGSGSGAPLNGSPGFGTTGKGPGAPLTRADGSLVVEIRLAAPDASMVDRLRDAGARIVSASADLGVVTAEVQPDRLGAIAALSPGVASIDAVPRPFSDAICPTGPTVSEGDAQLNAALARAHFGVDGSGVTVGILSDSYNSIGGAATDVANGELPGTGNPCGFTVPVGVQSESFQTTDEGRAMAQIVHDLAPGATIRFATANSGEQDMANQIRALAAAGAKVIVDDVRYLSEPMYQDGVIAQAVEDVTAAGVTYVASAGNSNNPNGSSSYEAPAYRPWNCPPAVMALSHHPIDCHDFDPGPGTDATYGFTVSGDLTYVLGWSEPQFGISTDLDFFVLNSAGNVVGGSDSNNYGTQRAYEGFAYIGVNGPYQLVVGRFASRPGSDYPRFRFQVGRQVPMAVEYSASSGGDIVGPSMFGHSASRSGVSVAAIPYNNANTIESFSARGPANYCWAGVTNTSTPAAPVSPCQSAAIDVAATDGTANSFLGTNVGGVIRFYGTSAAAPQAAAIAALVRQKAPCLVPSEVVLALQATAHAIAGFDANAMGAGRVDADAALGSAKCPPAKISADSITTLHVTGSHGVPAAGVAAVSLNVTVTSPDNGGYVTVYPCGTPPNASNLNFDAGQTIPNAVVAPVGNGGNVCILTTAATHLIADVNGWFPVSANGLQALTPARVLDTRTGAGGVPAAPVAAGGLLTKTVIGANGVPPAGVSAVSLNVTVTGARGDGYLTVFPCGTPPNASNLNFVLNQTIPNAFIAPLNSAGQFCITVSAATDVIVDVNGWFPAEAFTALVPSRVFDTRNGIGGVPVAKLESGSTQTISVLGHNGVPPTGVSAVALNVTVTDPTAAGYITVYPCGALPNASNVNFGARQTIPNAVIAPVGATGQVCFFTSAQTHLIADVSGWFPTGSTSFQGLTPARLMDSRQ